MPRKHRCRAACLALALCLSMLGANPRRTRSDEDPDTGTRRSRMEWEPGHLGPYRAMFIPFRPEKPQGAVPPEGIVDGRYARIRWGAGPGLLLALDAAAGRERLWIDLDHDGELADESRTTWWGPGRQGLRTERVVVRYGEAAEPTTLPVRFFRAASWPVDRVRITPWVHRRGRVELGGRLRDVVLVDGQADLRFDDPERDIAYLDLDGDGELRVAAESHERLAPGADFRLGEEGWRLLVPHPSGAEVVFERLDTAPPITPRAWPRMAPPTAGRVPAPPTETLEQLAARAKRERGAAYVQRQATVQKVGRLGTPAALELLLGIQKLDADRAVRAAAVRAMGHPAYRDEAGDRVLSWTRDEDAALAMAALQALHGMDHPEREATYREILETGRADLVRGHAGRHLAYVGTPAALALVEKAWGAEKLGVVRHVLYQGLRTAPGGPRPAIMVEAARATHPSLRATALRDLFTVDHPQTQVVALEAAAFRPVNDHVGKTVADVLAAEADRVSTNALLRLAAAGSPGLRIHVAKRLAPIRNDEAVAALLEAARDREEPLLRELAAHALAGIPRPEVTKALITRARKERDPTVLEAVLEALGDHRDPASLQVLLKYARKRKSAARRAATRALARVGFGNPASRKHLLTMFDARDWAERVLAIDAAAEAGEVQLAARVWPSLDHSIRQVRLAAAQALGVLRTKDAIPLLIERLAKEDETRIVDAVAASLYGITGVNLYDDVDVWRRWWASEGPTFELPDAVPPLPRSDAGGTRAGFYGIPVRSGRVIFLIDQSGSMSVEDARPAVSGAPSGNRLDVAVKEVIQATKELGSRDRVNVIFFHSTVHPWKEQLERLTRKNRAALERHVLAQGPTGGTNLYDGLEAALLDPEVDTVFLLSDGAPGAGKYVQTEDILRGVRRLNQLRRVTIHTVSIGRNSTLMRRLAEENGGAYVRR